MQAQPPLPRPAPSEAEVRWRALFEEFEASGDELLACLHEHETQPTQAALDALVRAQLRRGKALSDLLELLDALDVR